VRKAASPRATRWRLAHFLNRADTLAVANDALEPVRNAIATVHQQIHRII